MIEHAPVVEVVGLARTFPGGAAPVQALRGIDLTIQAGEFVAVMGTSGSGKSTLLHLIAGLDTPTAGTVSLAGQPLAKLSDDELTLLRRRRLGFVFQAFNLLEVLTAEENVALPLVLDGMREADAQSRARETLALVDLSQRATHLPGQLSGGEQQRVAIARALVTRPLILLADEPTGNLDSATGDSVLGLLRRLVDERGQTTLLVTHDARHASMADRLLRLRDGRVVEQQALTQPRSLGDFLGELD